MTREEANTLINKALTIIRAGTGSGLGDPDGIRAGLFFLEPLGKDGANVEVVLDIDQDEEVVFVRNMLFCLMKRFPEAFPIANRLVMEHLQSKTAPVAETL